jgi:hypothetical protein
MIGILAYGSLIEQPGWEIEEATDHKISEVETPFAIEYARKSNSRSGSPTLVPVENGKGWQVQACILALRKGMRAYTAKNMLYRRELHRIGDRNKRYKRPANVEENTVLVEEIRKYEKMDIVLYTKIKANFIEILDNGNTDNEKGILLATAAINSITSTTFFSCQDGVYYLAEAMAFGVRTKLTEMYCGNILHLAGDVSDLFEARLHIARQKKIIT